MDYYFDESGDWQNPGTERKRLLIAGLLFKDPDLEKSLGQEFRIFMADQKLSHLHASEMNARQKELCYGILNNYLTQETRVLARCFPLNILKSKTLRDPDQIYIDCAAGLIQVMALGDPSINVQFDMKFHYAYPLNVIQNINDLPWYIENKKKYFLLDPEIISKKGKALSEKITPKKWMRFSEKEILRSFASKIDPIKGDGSINPSIAKHVSDYLWSELWQQFLGREKTRESFKSQILSNISQAESSMGMPTSLPSLNVGYRDKSENRAGIIAIDLICNLVYQHGQSLARDLSSAEYAILEKIDIEDCGT